MDERLARALEEVEYGPLVNKLGNLNHLNDLVEFKQLSDDQLEHVAKVLLGSVVYEGDSELCREIFRVLETIALTHSSVDFDLNPLMENFSESNLALIANTLVLMAYTGKRRYIPIVQTYLNHSDPFVSKNAAFAMKYLA